MTTAPKSLEVNPHTVSPEKVCFNDDVCHMGPHFPFSGIINIRIHMDIFLCASMWKFHLQKYLRASIPPEVERERHVLVWGNCPRAFLEALTHTQGPVCGNELARLLYPAARLLWGPAHVSMAGRSSRHGKVFLKDRPPPLSAKEPTKGRSGI